MGMRPSYRWASELCSADSVLLVVMLLHGFSHQEITDASPFQVDQDKVLSDLLSLSLKTS